MLLFLFLFFFFFHAGDADVAPQWDLSSVPEEVDDKKALRAARGVGKVLSVTDQLSEERAEGQGFTSQLLLSDLMASPYAAPSAAYVQIGLWQKVARATHRALSRATGHRTNVQLAFQDVYMGKLTEHFGTDIDRLRQAEDDQEPFDAHVMELLVEALQGQSDMFDEKEKAAIIAFAQAGELK